MFQAQTLNTNLTHLESKQEVQDFISQNEKAVIVCGRMGPMCVPVYGIMEELRDSGKHDGIAFADMLFDHPDSSIIRGLPEVQNFRGLPFTVYYRNGKVVHATSSIQNAKQMKAILKDVFA